MTSRWWPLGSCTHSEIGWSRAAFATVDLFDLAHARAVLRAFGVAYDRFRDSEKGSRDKFLDQAVVELAQDGQGYTVWLAFSARDQEQAVDAR